VAGVFRSRAAQALAVFAAAFALAFAMFSMLERLGHPGGGVLIPSFNVVAPYAPEAAPVSTTLYNESYRYALTSERVIFTADLSSFAGRYQQPVLLITDAYAFVSVKLNGTPLSDQGGRDGPIPDRQLEPRLYYLTSALKGDWAKDPQILTIELKAEGAKPYLREVFVSEMTDGIFSYRARRFVAVEGTVAATAIAVFASLLSFAVTPLLQYRALAALFATMMMLWSIRNATFAGPISDVPWWAHQMLYYASTFSILVATVYLIDMWTTNSRFVQRGFAFGLIAVLALLYLPVMLGLPDGIALSRQVGNFVGVACFAMMIGQLLYALMTAKAPPWFEMFLFLFCLSVGVIELSGDAFPEMTRLVWPETGLSMAYGPLMPLPLAAGMLINFVRRTVEMRRTLEADNATLAQTVAAREAEISKVYAEREAEVRQKALMLERQRIMRDMHDGIGSQLLGLLLQARSGRLETPDMTKGLQESLDDLNLVVESLDHSGQDLAQALGAFRARIAPKCKAANVALSWDVDGLPPGLAASPAAILQIYRILQEACINALRHARPQHLAIRCSVDPADPGFVQLSVQDDGEGFDAATSRSGGRGLANMRRRAETAGGTFDIVSSPSGTRVAVRVPASAPH
jgi:signal transduction histidine kinase